jgi:hypothetical protein
MQLQTSYKLTIESTLYSFEDECIFFAICLAQV